MQRRNLLALLSRVGTYVPLALIVILFYCCIGSPLSDILGRDRFAKESQTYLNAAEPKIVHATLAWAKDNDCLRPHDADHFQAKIDAAKPRKHCSICPSGMDWSMLHYEIRQAMRNCARDRAEEDLGICRERLTASDEREFLPKDWVKREQLFEAHFRIARCWDRPSRPLAHLQSEYRELKMKLREFMREHRIE